tara:strand:- start:1782 stop:2645 length:864 start_codon:yes stop_codon:yes gene_type:complete
MNSECLLKSIENLSLLEIDLSPIRDLEKTRIDCILLALSGVTGFNIELDEIDTFHKAIEEARKLSNSSGRVFHEPYLKVTFTLDHRFEIGNENLNQVKSKIKVALDKKINILEISPTDTEEEVLINILDFINDISEDQLISLHTNRVFKSNAHLVNRTKEAFDKFGSRLLLNVDGATQSNKSDTYDQTIQTIATADILTKDLKVKEKRKYKKLPIYLSGDINKKTTGLAKLCGIDFCGLSVSADIITSLNAYDHSKGIKDSSYIENQLPFIVNELEYFKNLDSKTNE